MRPILLLLGLTFVSLAGVLAYGQLQTGDEIASRPASSAGAQGAPNGPMTRQLEQALSTDQTVDLSAVASEPVQAAPAQDPLINLAPKGKAKGARFVKVPPAD